MCERYTYGVPILSITSHILSLSVLLSLILGSLQSVAQARVFRVAQPQLLTHVLINEFMPAPTPGHEEWLELYNPGESAVDISGRKIDDDTLGGSRTIIEMCIRDSPTPAHLVTRAPFPQKTVEHAGG